MRLIDADKYREEMLKSREFDFFKTLDMQPTVKAIPMSVIEDIKAEIRQDKETIRLSEYSDDYDRSRYNALEDVFEIIDKHINGK